MFTPYGLNSRRRPPRLDILGVAYGRFDGISRRLDRKKKHFGLVSITRSSDHLRSVKQFDLGNHPKFMIKRFAVERRLISS